MNTRIHTSHGTPVTVCAADGSVRNRIELIPAGTFTLADGRGTFDLKDAAAVIKASLDEAPGKVLPIDFNHGLDDLGARDGEAAGWITALDLEGDRIMANVEWTARGEEALKGKLYRFVSPVFATASKSSRTITRILRAGLVNNPAIHDLAQVASSQEDADVDKTLQEQIAEALGLGDETDEAKITAAAVAAIGISKRAETIVTAAGLTGELTETAATAITTKLKATPASGDPDPSKYVPMEMHTEVCSRLAAVEKTVTAGATDQIVSQAMSDGKLTPAMKDWAASYAAKDVDGFKVWLASAPVIAPGGEMISTLIPTKDGELSSEEKEVCAAMGLSEAAFLATKQGKPLPKAEA